MPVILAGNFSIHIMKKILLFLSSVSLISFAYAQAPAPGTPGACGNSVQRHSGNLTPQDGSGTLGNSYSATMCGLNFTTASNRLGQRFTPVGVAQPAPFVISGLSSCDSIVKAFLYVEGSGTGAAQTATIQPPSGPAQNFPMTVIGTGPDKCWGYSGSYTYRADVTAVITGNGQYDVSGLLTNPPNSGEDMDGATLIVIYKDPASTYQGTIILDDGAIEISGGTASYNMSFPAVCGPTQNAQAFIAVGDIQMPIDALTMNSTSTTFTNDWWNYVQTGTTVTTGQTSANYTLTSTGDCFNLCVAGLYFQTTNCVVCQPSTNTLNVSTSSTQSTSCSACNGTATATPTPSGSYTYLWQPGGQTTQTATNLCPGVYTVTVTGNCVASTETVTVTAASSVSSTSTATNVTCNAAANGTATVTPSGGTPPYTYSWAPSGGNNATATNLGPGSYTCTITDANGCTSTQIVQITEPPAITTSSTNTPVSCNGGANGTGTVTASGGSGTFTYSWSPSGGSGASATGLQAGVYTVTVTDASGCTQTESVTVTQPPALALAMVGDSACPGSTVQLGALGSGGTGPYTYSWSSGGTGQTETVTLQQTTTYSVTVTDANGCTLSNTVTASVMAVPNAAFTSNTINGTFTLTGAASQLCFTNTSTGAVVWLWDFNSQDSSLQQSPCVTVSPANVGAYCVTMVAVSSNGCMDTANTCIEITDVYYQVPNVFTPNGDGNNDNFVITNSGMKTLRCNIYDRWGVLVYEWDTTTGNWDGKTNNGKEAVDGVYYYTLFMEDFSGKVYDLNGFVHLIRGK